MTLKRTTYNPFLLLITAFLLSLFSCTHDTDYEPEVQGERVKLELFTRATKEYHTPVTRAGVADETLDYEPYIAVFNNSGANFVEVVKSYRIPGKGKTYVELQAQSTPCKLLILANPQATFQMKNGATYTSYNFDETGLNTAFTGKSITAVQAAMYTANLANPQTTIPYTPGLKLPISIYEFDAPLGIKTSTKIAKSDGSAIVLERVVAKVIVEVDSKIASDFTLLGVTTMGNVPIRGSYHNAGTALPVLESADKTVYKTDNTYSTDIAIANNGTTAANPIYMYESDFGNGTYLILHIEYQGTEYYYKVAFYETDIDNRTTTPLDVLRNYEYKFTIKEVLGTGHRTVENAIAAPVYNNIPTAGVTIEVTDLNYYQVTAFDDYWILTSNSYYITYNNSTGVNETAFTLYADYKGNSVSPCNVISMTQGIEVVTGSSTFTPRAAKPVQIKFTSATKGIIQIEYANLRKRITVERRPAWVNGITQTAKPGGDIDFYFLSGMVDSANPAPVQFSASNGRIDGQSTLVEDGIINIKRTGTSAGTFYLTTIKNPNGGTVGEDASHRIKIDIK